jgi:transcriptional regulator with XRE-family HTH domain
MGKWEALIAARDRQHFSQAEAAKRLGVGLATYQRWELGKRRPQPQHLRNLCELFDLRSDDEPGTCSDAEMTADEPYEGHHGSLPQTLLAKREKDWALPALLATRLTAHLWSLALGAHATGEEKRAAIRRAIEESDSMHSNDTHYQITRREAMGTLATLPLITFGLALPGREVATARVGELLAYSAASLEACWELYDRGEANELLLGFQCASRYLAVLTSIGQASPQQRQEALRLATQYALLKTLLSRHCTGIAATTQYAREAIALSQETGDLPLQLSAFTKLTWTYLYEKDDRQALIAAQDAQAALERFEQQQSGEPLPPCIRGSVYSALALAQARNRLPSDRALAMAMERDPGSEVHAYMDFTRTSMLLEAGWVYCAQDHYARAMEILERRVDPQTFLPRMAGVSEIGRVETLNLMAFSASHAQDRDLEHTLHFWQAAAKGAKTLRSDTLFAQARTTYEHLAAVWPGEPRVRNLRDHLVHWSKA